MKSLVLSTAAIILFSLVSIGQDLTGKWVLSKVSPSFDVYQLNLKSRGGKCFVGDVLMQQGNFAITQACVVDDELLVVELTDKKSKYQLFYLMIDTEDKNRLILCDENVSPILIEGDKVIFVKQ